MKKALIVALFALLAVPQAKAQFSQITPIQLRNGDNSLAASFASTFTVKVGTHCTWSVTGTVATMDCTGAGSIGGSIANTQVAVGSGVNTIAGSAALTFTGTLNVTPAAMMNGVKVHVPDDDSLNLFLDNASAAAGNSLTIAIDNSANTHISSTPNNVIFSEIGLAASGRITMLPDAADPVVAVTGQMNSTSYSTATNCADSAGAAACGSAAAGAFVVDAAATTTVVSTTAVTANSEIFVFYDSSLGTRLSVTCNTTAALPSVTARTAATSFTVTVPVAPITNPACYSYMVIN